MTARLPPPPPLPVINEPRIVAVSGPLIVKRRPAHASNFSAHPRLSPGIIVLHCTDGHEGFRKDDDVAAMFAGVLEKPRSAHYVVDADSCTRCVPDLMTAYHCGHTGNAAGIGVELCGSALQSRAQWLDATSLATLTIAARLVADLCRGYNILPRVVNDRDLLAGRTGITTHSFVSQAWKQSSHHDPGPGFPLGAFVMAVRRDLLLEG